MSLRAGPSAPTTTGTSRLAGVDAARGLALLGMFTVHVIPNTDELTGEATLTGELLAGRSAALFAVLAGVGLALMTSGSARGGRSEKRLTWDRKIIAVRAAVIIAIGLALPMLDSAVAIILVHYGCLFLLALPFLRLGARALAGLTAGWVAVAPVLYWWWQNSLRPGEPGSPTMDSPERLWNSPQFFDLTDPATLGMDLAVTGYYPLVLWPAYLFAGMTIGRLNLRRFATAAWLLFSGAIVAIGTWVLGQEVLQRSEIEERIVGVSGWQPPFVQGELLAGTHELPLVGEHLWFLLATPHEGSPVDLLHTLGCAAAVIGFCLIITKPLPVLFAPLTGAGAMPLSLYVGHLVVLSMWRGDGSDGTPLWPVPEDFRALEPDLVVFLLVGGALLLGLVKVILRRRGPLEAGITAVSSAVCGPRP